MTDAASPVTTTIFKVVEATGLTPRTLRHWESEGLITSSRTGRTSPRTYDADQVARIRRVMDVRRMGFSIREVRDLLALEAAGDDGAPLATRMRMFNARAAAITEAQEELRRAACMVAEERLTLHRREAAGVCKVRSSLSASLVGEARA
ncbi:MerR family transcriptional regulator [Albimonas sp. CAU 1670]|uniref:MerR family transcriptional regulator n=1 Tax=Albimonas sp. CAU 1670 TaxID=3032599 RepID=UPI0023DC1CCE|nr:MerR family transcriptional regulator [Albimonas sp. CAU 1670]MDF2234849.1 MerR family transcriptional regulator [Albimonas sp. CAU 1670]